MSLVHMTAAAVLLLQVAAPAPKTSTPSTPKQAAAANPADVGVTVTYKGKGTVDPAHKVIVFAFADSNITSDSRPIDTQFASKNGETVTFKNVSAPVYVFAVYDEKGTYDGLSGPPPSGTPSTIYRKQPKGTPTVVAPGSPAIKFAFDDSERWSK